jgi:hypothetical protein
MDILSLKRCESDGLRRRARPMETMATPLLAGSKEFGTQRG